MGKVARSATTVMALLGVAKIVGLFRQQLIASTFGTGSNYDAYTAAFAAPDLLFTLISGGALAHAFIPIFSGFLTRGERDGARDLVSGVTNTLFLVAAVLSAIVALAAPLLVAAQWGIAPGYAPDVQALTINLLRIILFSTVVFAISSLFSGVLHAHQHFLLPAVAPLMYDLGIVGGLYFLVPRLGIYGLAWGAVIGSLLHVGVQVPGLLYYRVGWRFALGWRNPDLRRVGILMLPRIIDLLMARASLKWFDTNLASRLSEGSVSALKGYAWPLMQVPQTLIGTAIGIVIFPTMAELAAREDGEGQRLALSGSLRAIFSLTIPAAVGLLVLGRPIIRILFERGEFTAESTSLVFFALQFYALGLITHSMLEVVARAFFAQQDTLTPLLVSFFTTALNIALALWLVRPLLHGGLALANSIAIGVESLIGLVILHRRWGDIEARRLVTSVLKSGVSAAVMGGVIVAFERLASPSPLYLVVIGGALGGLVYFGMAAILRMDELQTIVGVVWQRLRFPAGAVD
jgi:putative peptidoglycan lipid II flippase